MRHAAAAGSHSSGSHSSGTHRPRPFAVIPRLALPALLLLAACQPRQADPAPGADDPPPAPVGARGDTLPSSAGAPAGEGGVRYPADRPTGAGEGDAEIQRLYREVYALARAGGCTQGGDCAAAPVGSKPCGGPWEYVIYCRLTTDTVRLRAALAELERRQRDRNARSGMASTCEMMMEPEPVLAGGRCAAAGTP